MHVPPHKLLPQDLVDLLDHGPADQPNDPPVVLRMHVQDARHAMQVEPERYTLTPDVAPWEPTEGDDAEDEGPHTGATGPAWYPPQKDAD